MHRLKVRSAIIDGEADGAATDAGAGIKDISSW
jgi:hypothetical protein